MKFIDIPNPERINRLPDSIVTLFSGENYLEHDFIIQKIELKLFVEKNDEKRGTYSLITSFLETDKGSIEMIYDEGYLGEYSLEKSREFLISNLGLSGLILRSIISLKSALKND
jgi:hypothetical protein